VIIIQKNKNKKLVLGFEVTFFKSMLYGGVDSIWYRFLGLPVGANLRRQDAWQESMLKKLNGWKGHNLLGMAIYTDEKAYFSFYPR
jgi:hypothetical protein